MAQTQAMLRIQHITQPDLPQIVTALLVVTALRQTVALVCARHKGVKVGRVIRKQAPAHQLLLFPDPHQPPLRLIQLIVLTAAGLDAVKAIPKGLRTEPFGRKLPQGLQDRSAVPVSNLRLLSALTD